MEGVGGTRITKILWKGRGQGAGVEEVGGVWSGEIFIKSIAKTGGIDWCNFYGPELIA